MSQQSVHPHQTAPKPAADGEAISEGMRPLLRVRDLRTSIRTTRGLVHAVDGVSFDVRRGDVLGIVGESGCGKSMTALSILRLVPRSATISADELTFDGRDVLSFRDDELRMFRGGSTGMVFQDPMTSLNPVLRIGDQISEALHAHQRLSRAQAAERVVGLLRDVNIPSAADRVRDY